LLQLTKIDLSQNRLSKIEKYSFQNLPSLYFCDLSHNYLDQLIDVFDENVTIQTLDLSFNFIKNFENSHGFKLVNLHLYHNGLRLMKKEFFKGNILSNIESFYLGLNELYDLGNFLFNNKTKRLYLNSNKFRHIKSLSLSNLHQLELLDLSNNRIQYVDPQDFSTCLNLKTLNLSKNQILNLYSVSFSGLFNLESLIIV
jgi:Leucine-rich repeat (LRR) protein